MSPAPPPWFDEDVYSLYFLLQQNQRVRRNYAYALASLHEVVSPDAASTGILRANHLALASEVHKAFEIFTALSLAGKRNPKKQFGAIFDVNVSTLTEWLNSLTPQTPLEEFRLLFPYATPAELGLQGEEARAVGHVVEANARALRDILLFVREQRHFLSHFRNRWSHTLAFQLFGEPSPGVPFLPVPMLKVPGSGGQGKTLDIVDRVLLASPEHNAALLRMLDSILLLEGAIIEARMNMLRNENKPYLPRWCYTHPSDPIPPSVIGQWEKALRRADTSLKPVQFQTQTSIEPETIAKAQEFYRRRQPRT